MQLIITQVEIEQALKSYVSGLLVINDGMRIDITLRAERGEDGTSAVINILPADAPKVEATQTKPATRAPRGSANKAKTTPAPVVEPTPEEPQEEEEEEPQVEPDQDLPFDTDSKEDPEEEPEAEETEVEKEPEPEVKETKPKSLFANLRKPVNG